MASILAIDVGGSSIKFGRWHNGQLTAMVHFRTPATLAGYYQLLEQQSRRLQQADQVLGAAIATCGAVIDFCETYHLKMQNI